MSVLPLPFPDPPPCPQQKHFSVLKQADVPGSELLMWLGIPVSLLCNSRKASILILPSTHFETQASHLPFLCLLA